MRFSKQPSDQVDAWIDGLAEFGGDVTTHLECAKLRTYSVVPASRGEEQDLRFISDEGRLTDVASKMMSWSYWI
jgi:hypothetical protein